MITVLCSVILVLSFLFSCVAIFFPWEIYRSPPRNIKMFHLDTLLHSHRLTPRLTGVSTGHTTQSIDTYRSALASGCAFILSLSPPAGQADIRVISEYKIGTGVPSAGRSARPEDGGRGRPRLVYRPRSEPGLSGLSLGREAVVWSVRPWSGQGFGTPQWGLQRNTSLSDRCQHETSNICPKPGLEPTRHFRCSARLCLYGDEPNSFP